MRLTGEPGRRLAAAVAGVLAAAAALGVAELVAAFTGPESSPVVVVGDAVVDLTPRPVKDFAIATFGEQDKLALMIGTLVLLTVFAAGVGVLALSRATYGALGVAAFGGLGVLAAVTRPGATSVTALPSLLGAVAGVAALLWLAGRLGAPDGWGRPVPTDGAAATVDRRGLLIAGGVVIAGGIGAAVAGRLLSAGRYAVAEARRNLRLPPPAEPASRVPPGTDLRIRGITPWVTGNADFYRVDTALVLPQVEPDKWSLRVHGRVRRELRLSFADLLGRPMVERDITLACVSNEVGGNLVGNARWLGVPLADVLAEAGVDPSADQILSTSEDGWTCSTPTAVALDGRDALLAVGMNGQPLPVQHGFPVRMVIPGLYGFVSATKWVVDLELTTYAAKEAYWTQREWADRAPIKLASRIDVPDGNRSIDAGRTAVAGVAWAQHTGIRAVEVRVDAGPWRPARLAAVPSTDTWRQWVYEWDARPGSHRLAVRATDEAGTVQPADRRDPFPDGATGWHTVDVQVK